jgi:hypothetical protein
MVAVPETAGVHWKTCSGEAPVLPQLPVSALVPLVVPVNVPPDGEMTVGLVQSPTSAGEASLWQTASPSSLQRRSMSFLHLRGWPPAPTQAAIWSRHAFRHCRERDTADAELTSCSAASSVSSDTNTFGRSHIRNTSVSLLGAALRKGGDARAACRRRATRHARFICESGSVFLCEEKCALPYAEWAMRKSKVLRKRRHTRQGGRGRTGAPGWDIRRAAVGASDWRFTNECRGPSSLPACPDGGIRALYGTAASSTWSAAGSLASASDSVSGPSLEIDQLLCASRIACLMAST